MHIAKGLKIRAIGLLVAFLGLTLLFVSLSTGKLGNGYNFYFWAIYGIGLLVIGYATIVNYEKKLEKWGTIHSLFLNSLFLKTTSTKILIELVTI